MTGRKTLAGFLTRGGGSEISTTTTPFVSEVDTTKASSVLGWEVKLIPHQPSQRAENSLGPYLKLSYRFALLFPLFYTLVEGLAQKDVNPNLVHPSNGLVTPLAFVQFPNEPFVSFSAYRDRVMMMLYHGLGGF
uniref:Uncharacterized protein n=1 Tax=Cannabis sativa TaxID=3483 RepID=A0A803Q2J2_CANSA